MGVRRRAMAVIGALTLGLSPGFAQKPGLDIDLAGVKHIEDCATPLKLLQTELTSLKFPARWTIVVACTPVAWDALWRKAGEPSTHSAFSSLQARVTVLNGAIFRQLRNEYRHTMAHELGHIQCRCEEETRAEAEAGAILRHTAMNAESSTGHSDSARAQDTSIPAMPAASSAFGRH